MATRPWIYFEDAFPEDLAQKAFQRCIAETIDLPQRPTKLWGRVGYEPRLSQLYSIKKNHAYKYSGVTQIAKPFDCIPEIETLLVRIDEYMMEQHLPAQAFDTALVNHYRANQDDKVGAHRDKDGMDYIIASVSLGRAAKFIIYRDDGDDGKEKVEEMLLQPNSLLLMLPEMQKDYLHEIRPFTLKEKKADPSLNGARINITLRKQLV